MYDTLIHFSIGGDRAVHLGLEAGARLFINTELVEDFSLDGLKFLRVELRRFSCRKLGIGVFYRDT
jgi:hypothetical protein